jgi:pimeloyl-ACP methyl ester carboxylesterase
MFHERQVVGADGGLRLAEGSAEGPPLLFLHGVGRCWQDFTSLLADLSSRWHVMASDLRGHGRSDRTPGMYLVRDYMRDVLELCRQLDEPLVIYGHSLGAMVAGAVAATLGSQVRGAILEDPPYKLFAAGADGSPFHSLFTLMRAVSGSHLPVSELAGQLSDARLTVAGSADGVRLGELRDATSIRFGAASLKRVDPAVWDPVLAGAWLEGLAYERLLPEIKCPTLVLQGSEELGGMVSIEAGRELEQLIPDCYRLHWQDAGHLIHNLLPERTLRVVREFLDSIQLDPNGMLEE